MQQGIRGLVTRVTSRRATCQVMRGIEQRMGLPLLGGAILDVVLERIHPRRSHIRVGTQVELRIQ